MSGPELRAAGRLSTRMPDISNRALARRAALAALVTAPWIWTGARAQPAAPLRPTPAQTEGPFYPLELPADSDHDLLRNGMRDYRLGTPAWVEGRVLDAAGRSALTRPFVPGPDGLRAQYTLVVRA